MTTFINGETVYTSRGKIIVNGDMSASGVSVGEMPSTLNMWLDAADPFVVVQDSLAISGWNDKSGYARNFTQFTALKKPTWSSVSGINGLRVVFFDGVSGIMTIPNRVLNSQSGHFIVALNGQDVIALNSLIGACSSEVATGYMITYFSSPGGREAFNNNLTGAANFGQPQNRLDSIISYISSGNAYAIQRNGTYSLPAPIPGVNNGNWFGDIASSDNLTIGAIRYNATDQQYFYGAIGEIMYFENTVLVGAELSAVKLYLSRKWNIPNA